MNNNIFIMLIAMTGGVLLSIQGGLNAQLGVLLKNPLLATLAAYLFSTVFALVFVFVIVKDVPSIQQIKAVPGYLWFTGAFFSVVGISLYYYTIPKLGISTMISIGLFGQMLFSVIAGHYAWFGLPKETIDVKRLVGVSAMILGIYLINKK